MKKNVMKRVAKISNIYHLFLYQISFSSVNCQLVDEHYNFQHFNDTSNVFNLMLSYI